MIRCFSTTIRRKEMDAVLTCMVDEKIGPGELNARLIQAVKEFFKCDGAVALRSPALALKYALRALELEAGSSIMISALAPAWQFSTIVDCAYKPLVLDVDEASGVVNADIVSEGIKNGGRLLVLHEAHGIVPQDIEQIAEFGIPIIEDISESAGAEFNADAANVSGETSASGKPNTSDDANAKKSEPRRAGSFGSFAILGLEERNVITSGGGAVIIAPSRREWIALKKYTDEAPLTDLLPDLNAALAWVELREFKRNEEKRREIFNLYQRACMSGRHRPLARDADFSTMSAFPLVLTSAFKDVKQYAERKDIEVRPAFENSVITLHDEFSPSCMRAKSLFLRCALFPLYPRLSTADVGKIVKVLGTLP